MSYLYYSQFGKTNSEPISIIAPFTQGNSQNFASSTKSLLSHSDRSTPFTTPFGSCSGKSLKRNQSFHGFQTNGTRNTNNSQNPNIYRNLSNPFLNAYVSQKFHLNPNFSSTNIPIEYFKAPDYFLQTSQNIFNSNSQDFQGLRMPNYSQPSSLTYRTLPQIFLNNPFSVLPKQPRVLGRRESDIRKSRSGISTETISEGKITESKQRADISDNVTARERNSKPMTLVEKRFGSLELKKHKCYSPTFYSMRCKKHAKKRPVVYALPKKVFGDSPLFAKTEGTTISTPKNDKAADQFEHLTNSIKIMEHAKDKSNNSDIGEETLGDNKKHIPKPAPRCKRHRRVEIIYQNISKTLKEGNLESGGQDMSTSIKSPDRTTDSNSSENTPAEISITQVQVHSTPQSMDQSPPSEQNDATASNKTTASETSLVDRFARLNLSNSSNRNESTDTTPKLVSVSHKTTPTSTVKTPTNSCSSFVPAHIPVLKCSPNFIKPKTESPKGALSLQIQARKKSSPKSSPNPSLKSVPVETVSDENTKENFPLIPQMPILDTETKWSSNLTNQQNAFYTLTTPHYKQVTSDMSPHYSATIPHPKHAKLIPRTLFNDQQISKSKSFTSKPKQKKHFQIPIQKCHSFKFQTAESYFQPIKNIHEEDFIRNGYVSDYGENSHHVRHHKRERQKSKGPLVIRGSNDYQENVKYQPSSQNSVQLKYPQPLLARASHSSNRPNGVVYADLDMPKPNNKKNSHDHSSSQVKPSRSKSKTEYATLKFNDIGQEIDV